MVEIEKRRQQYDCKDVTGVFDAFCRLHRALTKESLDQAEPFTRMVEHNSAEFGEDFKGCLSAFDNPSQWGSVI